MSPFSNLSVLLVEDEYLVALDAEQIINSLGVAKVETVGTFKGAKRRAEEGQYDLAVLDVNINGDYSFPIAKILTNRGIPVIYASGYELRDRPLSGFEGGICVSKPYTTDGLKEALTAALAEGPPGQ